MSDKLAGAAILLLIASVAMWLFGGSSDEYDAKHTIYVDCTKPSQAHSPICTGEAADKVRAEDAREDAYWQNIGR